MNKILLIIKGFVIGTANIIPGLSGGTIMMSLGIFEEIIYSVNHFFNDVKKNTKYLLCILTGVLLSIALMSRVITFSLDNFLVPTIIFFVGLILGGFPILFDKIKTNEKKKVYFLSFIIPFLLIIFLSIFDVNSTAIVFSNMQILDYVLLFLIGAFAAGSMVIPGLSGSFMLILFGYYEPVLETIKDFTAFNNIFSNFVILLVFGLGVLFGLFVIIRLIEFLLNKYKVGTYYSIIGFVSASVISIILTNFTEGITLDFFTIIMSIILLPLGIFATYKLGD